MEQTHKAEHETTGQTREWRYVSSVYGEARMTCTKEEEWESRPVKGRKGIRMGG